MELKLKTKAETLAGLCGELSKKQADFENYAEAVLKEAMVKSNGAPIKFRATDLLDKTYSVMLRPDTFHMSDKWGCPAFIEGEDGEAWYGLQEIDNGSLVELVKNITEAVEKGEEA